MFKTPPYSFHQNNESVTFVLHVSHVSLDTMSLGFNGNKVRNGVSNSDQAFSQGPKRGRPILVGRGGGRENVHISICSKLVRNFSNTLGFVSIEFVPLCFFT